MSDLGHIKQVILVRKDLNMRKGKIAAQVAHASMKVFFDRADIDHDVDYDGNVIAVMNTILTPVMKAWVQGIFTKIVLSVDNETDLVVAYEEALKAGLPAALIVDSGATEFHGIPTKTTVAIGPALSVDIDMITGPSGSIKTSLL